MTDPDAVEPAEAPPPQPPRPAQQPALSQLEADEQYARLLANQYENDGAYEARTSNRGYQHGPGGGGGGGGGMPRGRQQTGLNPNELRDDREHSFLDDDLPVIRENLRKGFVETQATVNSWISNIKKKINEEFNDEDPGPSAHTRAAREEFMGRQGRGAARRSGDYDRYDADPELLSDDFAGMRFNSDGTPAQRQPNPNPNLFKPPPPSTSPKPKVAFRDAPEEIDAYDASPKLPPKDAPGAGAKASKWQPLSAVEPSPITDNDPFSLGDSDDEKDAKKGGDIKMEDSERLSKATAEAMADSLVDEPKAKPAETKKA